MSKKAIDKKIKVTMTIYELFTAKTALTNELERLEIDIKDNCLLKGELNAVRKALKRIKKKCRKL
jgi:hypothetical protein